MKYHYDPKEDSLKGYYQCGKCRQILSTEIQHHKGNCAAKNGKDLVFVFGKKLVQHVLTQAQKTGCETTITYGGLSVKLIKKHCPEALR